jgi:hypothetical protein
VRRHSCRPAMSAGRRRSRQSSATHSLSFQRLLNLGFQGNLRFILCRSVETSADPADVGWHASELLMPAQRRQPHWEHCRLPPPSPTLMDWTVAVADGIALLKLCFVRRLTGEKHCSEAAMLRFKSVIEPSRRRRVIWYDCRRQMSADCPGTTASPVLLDRKATSAGICRRGEKSSARPTLG